jgi:hypothetical protein
MTPRDFEYTVQGKTYRQNYLPSKIALRLHAKVLKLGFGPIVETVFKLLDGEQKLTLAALAANPKLGGDLLAGAYELIKTVEPEDIEQIYGWLAEHTFITTGDGIAEQRLDAAANHFADARDMWRYYTFIFEGCKAQLTPFFEGLRTVLPSETPRKAG